VLLDLAVDGLAKRCVEKSVLQAAVQHNVKADALQQAVNDETNAEIVKMCSERSAV
jgi:hypothetical protein